MKMYEEKTIEDYVSQQYQSYVSQQYEEWIREQVHEHEAGNPNRTFRKLLQ